MSEQDKQDAEMAKADAAHLEGGMAWEGRREAPMLAQLATFEQIIGRAEYEANEIKELVEEGCDEQMASVTLTISGREKPALSAALHLVGFFSEELGEIGKGMMLRLLEANYAALDALTPEEEQQVEDAYQRIHDKRMAAFLGELGIDPEVEDDEADSAA